MSSLVHALDNTTPQQVGENNHIEYTWNNGNSNKDIEERIVQLNFQMVRTNDIDKLNKLKNNLTNLLEIIPKNSKYIEELFRLACYTRDIINGKGEYSLFYMQLCIFYSYDKFLGGELLNKLFYLKDNNNKDIHPLGSWKDIKYLINYAKDYYKTEDIHVIEHSIQIMVNQIYKDIQTSRNSPNKISLAAKWCPREKSKKFGWIYDKIACAYYYNYIATADHSNKKRAINKCKMDFRKTLTYLNNIIDTLEIKQCNNKWNLIEHSSIPSIAMGKQKLALQNINKDKSQRYSYPDRISCSINYTTFINDVKNGIKFIKGKRVSMYDFVKDALKNNNTDTTKDIINLQWKDNATQNKSLENMIAMVDTSASMESDNFKALYNAIGLGIRVAELSKLGKRILTFSAEPTWLNLDDCNNLCDYVNKIKKANWGANTNFYRALSIILDTIIVSKLKPEDVENMTLAIFSDMQIDLADNTINNGLFVNIDKIYHDIGIRLWNKPFKTPHILFWNLRNTDGFPCLSTNKNCTMISGYNPNLLNDFCYKGLDAIKNYSPYNNLIKSLDNSRYNMY